MAEKRTVVIVEDEHMYKETLGSLLAERGLCIEFWGCTGCDECGAPQPFANAVTFIEQVCARPDCRLVAIVLDVNEDKRDASSLNIIAPQLTAHPVLQRIPFVVYSAVQDPSFGRRAKAAGATDWYNRINTTPRAAVEKIDACALP